MADKIYIAAAKGGAGATTAAAGLGVALGNAGERTLILDGDGLCASLMAVCKCEQLHLFTVADYAKGMCRAKQTAVQHPKHKNLYIMPTLGCKDDRATEQAVKEVDGLFDYILCDGAAHRVCDRTVIVTEPYAPSVRAADVVAGALKDAGMRVSGIIVNKINGGLVLSGQTGSAAEIANALKEELIAVIPEDLMLPLGVWRKQVIKYFKTAAQRLAGREVSLPRPEDDYSGAGGYLRRKMRERI